MSRISIALSILSIWLLTTPKLAGQESEILNAYIAEGLQSNLSLQKQQLNIERSREALRQAKGLFLPSVAFNATYTRAIGGRKIDFPVGDLLNPVYGTLNDLTQSNAFPPLENQSIQFLPDDFHETYLQVAYPIFNPDVRYNRDIQTHLLKTEEAKRRALSQELRFSIAEAYLQYLQSINAMAIFENAKTVVIELRRFNESLVKNNLATRDAIAIADYEISKIEQELALATAQKETARAYFNFLLNRDLTTDITIDSGFVRQSLPQYDLTSLKAEIETRRAEFQVINSGQAAANASIEWREAQRKLPELYLGAQLGFQGFGYRFDSDQAYGLAQVGLKYDLFTGGINKSKIQEARIESDKLALQRRETQTQINLQIQKAWHEKQAAQKAWLAALEAEKSAGETFRIVNNKYRAGQVLLLEFIDAETRLLNAQQQTNLALTQAWLKEMALQQAAGLP